ncbi:hypothetical protein [Parasegetibacter sp. NRK P23]|uniref:hypothetical protein n=1 Tax=Parasegetibacter sp. NRK P23 TaxID=2942999 RepID=UPI002043202B|nr:hypothetical protein [Parasegetibacter sp. NRK P23]MCM5528795.1 hypothetical protein [Parasegetibacter sp. NRK P23]
MKFRLPILLVSAVLLLLSCDKDTFETKPAISLKSLSATTVRSGGLFSITMEYTDKEGDLTDSIYMMMEVLNQSAVGEAWQFNPLRYKVPTFPPSPKGEITANFRINSSPDVYETNLPLFANPNSSENDTVNFKIWVRDAAQNYSDTITIEQVVFVR